nr:retrotransposon protein, putative, unclassified [Tanacetum cinerariifolium]
MMDIGTLCCETISFVYNLVRVSILSVARVGMKCADLATNRVSLDPDTSCQNLGRISNALSIPCKFSVLMFSSLIASVWASRICDGDLHVLPITGVDANIIDEHYHRFIHATGAAPRTNSIRNSTWRTGGRPEWKQYATMMRQNKNLMDINNILKQNQGDVNDTMELKKKTVVVTSDPLALIAEKTKVKKRKEKVVVSSNSKGSDADDFSELKKITALLAKALIQRKFYSKPTKKNLKTSSTSQSANKKQEFVKSEDKKIEKKDDEKKRDMSKLKCYKCKKEGHFAKDCKKVKVNDYEYYKTKINDSDQEINANKVFMAQIKKVLSDSETSSLSADDKISEVSYYISESKSESKYETLEYYDNTTTYALFVNDNDDQEIFHDCENFLENVIESQINHNESVVDHNDSETSSAFVSNDAMNVSCNSWMCDSFDENSLFIFDDESVRISLVSKMPFRKKTCNSLNVRSKRNSNKSLPRTMRRWLPKIQQLAEPVAKWIPKIVQIYLWIINSGCSKHMTGNCALLTNFVEKFLGTVHFGNNDFAVIAGYGDVVFGSITIKKVYYVEGLPKMKFEKDHLCSACEQGKIHRKHHKFKMAFVSNKPLYLFHMDLYGPMRVESINGKRYVLVVVDDYSRYTWVLFLHSKDEASDVIMSFTKKPK